MLNFISKILSSSVSLLVVSLVLFMAFGSLFYLDSEVKKSTRNLHNLTINAERILNADLSSTTAVRLAASLQSERYVLNYQAFQDTKYALLTGFSEYANTDMVKEAFVQMEDVQQDIEDAESEALALIDEEEWEGALELVTEPAFRRQKGIYRANLSRVLREMIVDSQTRAHQSNYLAKTAQYSALGMFLVLALIGVMYSREMRRSLKRQSELAANLEDANVNLEQKVEERTDKLHERTNLLQAILGSMAQGIVAFDKNLKLISWNDHYKGIRGYPDELLKEGRDFKDLMQYDIDRGEFNFDNLELDLKNQIERAKRFEVHAFERKRPDGSFIDIRGGPIPGGGFVSTFTDITERKRAEVDLMFAKAKAEKASKTAEEATKAKATFLATMSHEIRTPMGGVIGMVDLLQQSKMTDDQRQMINTVGDSAQSLLTIINDILDFSKIEAGKLDLEEIPISIRDVVEGAGEALAVTARNKNISLSVYIDPDLPDALIGDQVRLRQILFNFGTNAIKFTEKGKVLIRAEMVPASAKEKITVRFQVIDEGIGIPEGAQKNLFQAFSQVDASTTRRFGGTGLGLTICQRLIEIMNGKIGVESVLGEGSTFSATVSLPIAKEHTFESDGHDLTGLNILFAHIDDDMRDLTPHYLEHWNAKVITTAEIDMIKQIALDAVKVGVPFDVICLGSGWSNNKRAETIELLQMEKKLSATRYVITCRSRVRADRKELDNTVYVDSGPLKRAAFIKSIAVAAGRASPEDEYDDSKANTDVRVSLTVAEAEAMGQLILLAEDNLTNQDVIRRQLTMLGYTLEIANDGQEALELLKSKSYAILLTDCHMPNMDGFELTQAIRKSEEDKDIRFPIIAVTASVMKEEVDHCFASGMDDFIAKPMEMKKLKETLQKWMPVSEYITTEATKEPAAEETLEAINGDDGENNSIDPSALKSVFGDDEETFKEILNDFVEPATSNVDEIVTAFNDRSADGVAKGAHKLKSSSRSIGANELADLCQTLETAGKDEDWDKIDQSAPLLKNVIQEVTDYIKAL